MCVRGGCPPKTEPSEMNATFCHISVVFKIEPDNYLVYAPNTPRQITGIKKEGGRGG